MYIKKAKLEDRGINYEDISNYWFDTNIILSSDQEYIKNEANDILFFEEVGETDVEKYLKIN